MQTTAVKHGIYNIRKHLCYRELSESAVGWFLDKHKLSDTCVLVNLQTLSILIVGELVTKVTTMIILSTLLSIKASVIFLQL